MLRDLHHCNTTTSSDQYLIIFKVYTQYLCEIELQMPKGLFTHNVIYPVIDIWTNIILY